MPKVLKMPEAEEQPNNGKAAATPPPIKHILPDADEEHASVAMINKWVGIGDAALMDKKTRKIA